MSDSLICFDLDGTLLDQNGGIHPEDLRLLMDPGLAARLIPATGRPLDSLQRTFARNGLYPHRKIPLAMVLENGSLLYAADEVCLAYDPFESAVQAELVGLARRFPGVTFFFLGAEEIEVLWPSAFGMQAAEQFEFRTRAFSASGAGPAFSKVMCISPSPAALDILAQQTAALPVERALSMPTILEFTPAGINKGSGLQKLLRLLGRDQQPIYAAGDGENDLPMFELARISCAPDDAPQNVRARAGLVVSVAAHGILRPLLDIAARDLALSGTAGSSRMRPAI